LILGYSYHQNLLLRATGKGKKNDGQRAHLFFLRPLTGALQLTLEMVIEP
jgi:hypothetical protein